MARKRKLTRRQKVESGSSKPTGKSRYGRKRIYLNEFGGWGWQYAEPKPWR